MRILSVTSHLNIGGIANYIVVLSRALAGKGVEPLVASGGGNMESEMAKSGIGHVRIDFRTKSELSPKVILGAIRLSRLIREKNIGLVHAHTRVTQVAACIASRLTGVPYVTTCHGFFRRRLGRMLFGCWGKKVVAISEPVRISLIDDFRVDAAKVELIRTGIELDRFSKVYSDDEIHEFRKKNGIKGALIGTIGRLSPVKGQRVLIEAIALMTSRGQDVEGIIVGDGPEEMSLKRLTKGLKIEGRIHFFKSSLETEKYLAMMDVFVFPSIKEGLGLGLLEAMASGRPCVASSIGGIADLIKDGENGILFPVGDSGALGAAITRLLKDEGFKARLGERGRSFARQDFSVDEMADKMLNLYKAVLKG